MADMLPFKPIRINLDLQPRIEKAFAELIHEPWGRLLESASWEPAIDVYETGEAYLIEADLPGVPLENIEVRLEGRQLTICGIRRSVTWTQSGQTLHVERAHGHFCRSLHLSHAVDLARMEKQCENGILRIRLPKTTTPA
ncbi:MAG: Hsp20/alpha crystallin family protein [Planctomycetaceae bacterium]